MIYQSTNQILIIYQFTIKSDTANIIPVHQSDIDNIIPVHQSDTENITFIKTLLVIAILFTVYHHYIKCLIPKTYHNQRKYSLSSEIEISVLRTIL